jgi:hypothetical protein
MENISSHYTHTTSKYQWDGRGGGGTHKAKSSTFEFQFSLV